MAFVAWPFAMEKTFICNQNPASRWRAISRMSLRLSPKLPAKRFVLDGELAIPIGSRFSFDELQLRLHPAASRVRKLADAHPAWFIAFDLLGEEIRYPSRTTADRTPLAARKICPR